LALTAIYFFIGNWVGMIECFWLSYKLFCYGGGDDALLT
jgi:hypothetical protein